ncbi:MAG TPA: hypothetical protein VL346_03010 [Acidobacteriaceae bacterium]|nr:hypothetical protein [Acidobacteriaceae bacterium]
MKLDGVGQGNEFITLCARANAWISDESSLWDFHTEQTNDLLIAKIRDVYGVDVSDIESARLWEIIEHIKHPKPLNTITPHELAQADRSILISPEAVAPLFLLPHPTEVVPAFSTAPKIPRPFTLK